MLAKDVMTTSVVTVNPDARVEDVARLLLARGISAVPVVDARGRVLGIVSEGDLIRRPETGTERRPSWWLSLLADPDRAAAEYAKSHGRTARDVMTRDVISVGDRAPLERIAALLEQRRIKRVPVVRGGRLGRNREPREPAARSCGTQARARLGSRRPSSPRTSDGGIAARRRRSGAAHGRRVQGRRPAVGHCVQRGAEARSPRCGAERARRAEGGRQHRGPPAEAARLHGRGMSEDRARRRWRA
ncbi:MAG: CBS domain-containing protein [Burkholderiales bacterium]|nr:CBS domain-containing protein [Burkholderiales bacterium]